MKWISWIGVVVLAALAVWFVTSPWQASTGARDEASLRTAASPGSDPNGLERTPAATGAGLRAGANAANAASGSDPASPNAAIGEDSNNGPAQSASGAAADGTDFAAGASSGGETWARGSAGPSDRANVAPGAGADDQGAQADLSGAAIAGPSGAERAIRSGFDEDARSDASGSDPVADEIVIDYLARRSLGENPTPEQLNERRGWAATLLSGESQEVRDQLNAQASEAEAGQ